MGAGVDFAYLAATREHFHNLFEDAQKNLKGYSEALGDVISGLLGGGQSFICVLSAPSSSLFRLGLGNPSEHIPTFS